MGQLSMDRRRARAALRRRSRSPWLLAGLRHAINGDGGLNFDVARAGAGQMDAQLHRGQRRPPRAHQRQRHRSPPRPSDGADGRDHRPSGRRRRRPTTPPGNCWARSRCARRSAPSRVRVEVRAPRLRLGRLEIKWTVKVPKGVAVDLRTDNGGVRIVGLSGEVRARDDQRRHDWRAAWRRRPGGVDASTAAWTSSWPAARRPTAIVLRERQRRRQLTLPGDSKADIARPRASTAASASDGLHDRSRSASRPGAASTAR